MLFTQDKPKKVNVEECFKVWDLLSTRYTIINHFRVQRNFIHDKDFKHILDEHIKALDKDTSILANELEKINIKGPEPAVRRVNVKGNSEVTRDEDIASVYHNFLKSEVVNFVKVFRNTTTNDSIRKLFIKMTKKTLNHYFDYTDYLKAKSWIEKPPLYRYVPSDVDSEISTSEVYNLWDHLTYRNINIHLTKTFSSFVGDADYKKLLDMGATLLERQKEQLEDLLLKYGITLPPEYSNIIPTPESKGFFEDKFIYRVITNGMQNAVALHGTALAESIVNKDARNLFRKLTLEELDLIDQVAKYGKTKGWVLNAPLYQMD